MDLSHRRAHPATALGAALLATILATPAAVQGQPAVVSVDARGTAQQRASFRTDAVVTVRVVNKNPYVYRYRTTIDEEIVQETAPLLFVAQLSPLLSAIATPGGPGASSAPGPRDSHAPRRSRMRPTDACPAGELPKATAALTWIDDERDRVASLERDAAATARTLAQAYSSARAQIDTRRVALRARRATFAELDGAASALKQAAELYPKPVEVDGVELRLRAVEAAAKTLAATIDDYRETFAACQPILAGGNPLIADRVYLDGLLGWWLEDHRAVVTSARAGREALTALTAAIDRVRTEGSHEEIHAVGNYASPTNVTVTVRRWPIEDSDDKNLEVVAVAKLEFGGGRRFLLSGGLGFVNGILSQRFLQTRGYERNASGETIGQELVPVVGLARQETTTVAPALLLNTRLWRLPGNPFVQSLFGTMGITAKQADGVDVDYLLGLSAGALNDHVILTGALYFGKEQDLSGDLYVGAKIPDDLTDIPVKKAYGRGFGLFVTYRIR